MKKKVAIIGGGTAGLFAASFLDMTKYDVTIYEKKSSLGRKFLVAGDGGFNLTHSEKLPDFKSKYRPVGVLDNPLDTFTNVDLRAWFSIIGIETFIGSSGRVFPVRGIKPIQVLNAIITHIEQRDITFQFNKTFVRWGESDSLIFADGDEVKYDYAVFALGGSSWKVTGSDGTWLDVFEQKGVPIKPFTAVNCAFGVKWDVDFLKKHEGKPLKNIAIRFNDLRQKGEIVLTRFGIEGNAIYGLSHEVQQSLVSSTKAVVYIDFKPTFDTSTIITKLNSAKANTTTALRQVLKLSQTTIDLLKTTLTKNEYLDTATLAAYIKQFPLTITSAAPPIDEAISTTGGISLDGINILYELNTIKDNYCIGEMLDWFAPTGGYLIQGCASMGVYVAEYLNTLKP